MDKKSWLENKKVFITPFGGHGTTFLLARHRTMLRRPDVAFGLSCDCSSLPSPASEKQWRWRTKQQLDLNLTIEQNIVRIVLEHPVSLSGCCSAMKPFLTRNNVQATCIVRHPLHAYVSFMHHQHPNHAAKFGGFNTEGAVSWWCARWNSIVEDFITSGNVVLRYEHLPEDDKAGMFKRLYNKWDGSHCNSGILHGHLEAKLKLATEDRFYKFYKDWEM